MPHTVRRGNDDDVPAHHKRVEQIHYPDQSSNSHCYKDCDQLADEHPTKASELNGQMRDQWIYLECSEVESRQGGEQIENLKEGESPART